MSLLTLRCSIAHLRRFPPAPLGATRHVLSESIEPPSTLSIPRRDCTVVLMEDAYLYDHSWRPTFSHVLPHDRGIHICNLASINERNLQEGLDALETFLPSLENVVLISRGALVSLMAQYYLSSHSFAGLCMINPIPIDSARKVLQKLDAQIATGSAEHEFVERILGGKEDRPLKLEPGAVPTLILKSVADPDFSKAANEVALLHNGGSDGEVLVHDISKTSNDMEAIDIICNWIDDRVV